MTTTARPDVVLPSVTSVYRTRAEVELKEFYRQRESVVFTLLFPVILLVVFGAVLDYDIGGGVTFTQYFMAGIIAAGILGASLQNMAISIATERSDGTLKALADRVGVIARGRLVEVAIPSALGGRETAPAVVSWTEDGVRRSEDTATPTAFVRDLAARFSGEVPDLAVARPTLEDVYLRMIGEPA